MSKVFEYFYLVQTPDAGTSKLAGFPASSPSFLYTVMFSTSEKAFGFANGFGGIRCDSPEPERPAVPDVRPNYTPRVDYARNDRRAGNNTLYFLYTLYLILSLYIIPYTVEIWNQNFWTQRLLVKPTTSSRQLEMPNFKVQS